MITPFGAKPGVRSGRLFEVMMSFLSVTLLALSLAAAPQGQVPDQRAEAERLARGGDYARALQQFQALAAVNPDDIQARLWIARLHGWMGHPEHAIDVYRSIVATDTQNVEVLLGLGNSLATVGRLADAADWLDRAEAIAADQPAVLAAQGHVHRMGGRSTLALAYYQRALALDAGNRDAREAYDALRAERAHRLQATYYFEHFDVNGLDSVDVPETHAGILEFNARVSDSVRLFVGGQHHRKFSRDEDRAGGGVEWMPHRSVFLRAGGLFGLDTDILPDADAALDLEWSRRRVAWLGSVRYLYFSNASTTIVSPGLAVTPADWLTVALRYYRSHSEFERTTFDNNNDGFSARATVRAARRVWVTGGYTRGFEGLSIISIERLSQLEADTVSGGVRFDPVPMTSISATYEYQGRDSTTRVGNLFLSWVQRF